VQPPREPPSARTALITGGARGIGLAIARRLRDDGLRVSIADIDAGAVEARRAEGWAADRLDAASAAEVEALAGLLGGADVLVNNAGIRGPAAPVIEYPPAEWEAVLRVNLTGPFLVARAFAPRMKERGWGRIINIASMAGKTAYPLRSAYAATKWGLIGLTLTLARELGPHGVTVNAVCPGPIENEAMDEVIRRRAEATGRTAAEVRAEYLARLAIPRMPAEEDVASMVSYLASDASWAVTGQALDVSSGYA
jgi:NAD(P)-dependent dehydrogenase (short-subunit alcohol dehydrogenase family)